MTLLEFARGPALQTPVLILIAGIVWRLVGILLLRQRLASCRVDASLCSDGSPAGPSMILTRFIPRRTFWPRIAVSVVLSTVFHLGLAIIVFGGAPHILLIHQFTGLTWPSLPKGLVVSSAA